MVQLRSVSASISDRLKLALLIITQTLEVAAIPLLQFGSLLRFPHRPDRRAVQDLRLGDLGRVHALDLRDLGALFFAERSFFDAFRRILAAQTLHGELVCALRGLVGHTESIVDLTEEQVYERIGEDGFARLVRAFYAQVPTDDILGPMYPAADLAGAEIRLRDFLVGRFGGPPRYVEQRGHPRLRMRHTPFAIDQRTRDRWMQLMSTALDEQGFDPEVKELMREFLAQVATFMINRDSPLRGS